MSRGSLFGIKRLTKVMFQVLLINTPSAYQGHYEFCCFGDKKFRIYFYVCNAVIDVHTRGLSIKVQSILTSESLFDEVFLSVCLFRDVMLLCEQKANCLR